MSQSPIDDFSERAILRYRQGWKALNRLLHEDRSFSGHERNCAFLNTGQKTEKQFADVSAATGFDFDDDGRAVALTDWDFDGDIDIWVANRTAPRIRLLRNNTTGARRFVAIRLQGNGHKTNRDAIGARVEIKVDGNDSLPQVKTLTAGDGFLSQTSGWLHFGLKGADQVRQVVVHWPGDERKEYRLPEVNQRYIIDQSSGAVSRWQPPTERKSLEATTPALATPSALSRTVLPAPRLLPTLRVKGETKSLNDHISRPTVIFVWSATCPACFQELQDYSAAASRLRQAGLDVLGFNLDNVAESTVDPNEVIKKSQFPFESYSGTMEAARSIDILKRAVFDRWRPLAVPLSFLVDEQGFVYAIYQGPVAVDQFIEDLQLLKVPADELRAFCSPFRGRWINPPPSADPLQVVSRFIDEAMVTSGIEYLERYVELAESSGSKYRLQDPGDLFYVLAVLLRDQEQWDEAALAFSKAIEYRPDDFRFRSDYATLLAKLGKMSEAATQLRAALDINPEDVATRRKLAFVQMAHGNVAAAVDLFESVLQESPRDVACWYNLANAYRMQGSYAKAISAYQKTLEVQPKMILAANNLAWVLATTPDSSLRDGREAVRWAQIVCEETKYSEPSFLDTLACAYAERGDFEKAIETANRALEIFQKRQDQKGVAGIQQRLQRFRQDQPYRAEPSG